VIADRERIVLLKDPDKESLNGARASSKSATRTFKLDDASPSNIFALDIFLLL